MSEAYSDRDVELVAEESTTLQRAVDGMLGLCLASFVLAAAALVQFTSIQTELGGVTIPRLFGAALVLVGVGLVVTGVVSRLELVETDPSRSAGLAAGVGFGVVGFVLGIIFAGLTVGYGSPVWLVLALGVAVGMGVLTVAPREDLGTTLPASVVTLATGASLASGALEIGWVWNPAFLTGGFTGVAVIPVTTMFTSLVGGWAAAKARRGYGARGRQLGAYFLIYTNALSVIAVMVLIVLFVTKKGAGFAFQEFTIGPIAVLALVAVPLVALGRRLLVGGPNFETRQAAAKTLLQIGTFALLGVYAAASSYVLVSGDALELGFQMNTRPFIGGWLLTVTGTALTVYCWRTAAVERSTGAIRESLTTAQTWAGRAAGVLFVAVFLGLVFGPTAFGLPLGMTLGLGLAPVVAGIAVLAAAFGPAVAIYRSEAGLGQTTELVPAVRFGVGASLVFGLLAVLLEVVAQTVPAFLGLSTVPILLVVAGAVTAVGGVVPALVGRRDESSSDLLALGAAGLVGLLTLVGVHVALTGDVFPKVIGVTTGTAVNWPFAMHSTIPLGDSLSGILPAIVGTVWLVVGASLFAVPLGVGAAVFLTEYAEQGSFTAVVETATNALWSTPSVVFGLFGGAFIVPRLTRSGTTNLMAGMLVLGFMLLPLVLITSREAIKAVPDEYRDASAALGVNQWTTIRSVVLPAAMPGIITGVILGVGRIAGETAPLILVLGSQITALEPLRVLSGFQFTTDPPFVMNTVILNGSTALPTKIWAIFKVPGEFQGGFTYGWATAFVLLMVVLGFYAIGIASRRYFRRKLEHE